jgi:hypothetical protein
MATDIPSVSVSYAHNGSSTKINALGMRPMQEAFAEVHPGVRRLNALSPKYPGSGRVRPDKDDRPAQSPQHDRQKTDRGYRPVFQSGQAQRRLALRAAG